MKEAKGGTPKDTRASMRKEDERSNSVLSVRLTGSEMTKLKSVAEKTGRKISDIVKMGAGLGAGLTDQAYKKGFKNGHDEGFQEAKDMYAVYAICMKCHDGIAITDEEMRDETGLLFSNQFTCYHEDCGIPKERTGEELRRLRKKK